MEKVFAVVLLFFSAVKSATTIRLDGNGYVDILIVINPAVPENGGLLNQIKEMIITGSDYLFEALDHKVFFKEAKILVPPNWTSGKYEKATTETYQKGKIRIDNSCSSYGDEPYTHQTEGCAREGEYIHLTSNFLLNNSISKPYGPKGRLFVHEWAHLRWGVFDEYNEKDPFYVSGNQILPTSCNKISGQWKKIYQKVASSCEFDTSGFPTASCKFLPDAVQNINSSIMYMQSIDSINYFCREEDHNYDAPNEQNRQCEKATRTVIFEDSVDKEALSNLKPLPSAPPPPTFKIIQRGPRVVCLVLDVSGSMRWLRLELLRKAAGIFLNQIIKEEEYVALVTFSTDAQILTNLMKIEGQASRNKLIRDLPRNATGFTYICEGLKKGFEALRMNDGETLGKEIIFLTDGKATTNVSECLQKSVQSGAIIHTVALGPDADHTLKTMAEQTGGMYHTASEDLSSNELVDAFASKYMYDGNPFEQLIQLESTGNDVKDWFNGTVPVDKTVGNRTTFTLLYERRAPSVYIESPSGLIYDQSHTTDTITAKTITFIVPGTAETGDWKYSFLNKESSVQQMSLLVMSQAASKDVHPITVTVRMNQQTSDGTKPMVVLAEVRQNYNPVLGASVKVYLKSDTGHSSKFHLLDNGAGCDVCKDDGVYCRYFTKLRSGKYSLKVRVESQHGQVQSLPYRPSGALYVPGYIVDGKLKLNPPRPGVNLHTVNVDRFTRTVTGESIEVEANAIPNFPPNKITDLSAEIQEDTVLLNWTAPGEDYDHGTVQLYEIRWSEDRNMLQINFSMCNLINTSSLHPQVSGSAENYSFQPDIQTENGNTIFCAIQSMDQESTKSEISNIVRLTWAKHVSSTESKHRGLTITVIIIFICVVAMAAFVITVVIRRDLKKKNSYSVTNI